MKTTLCLLGAGVVAALLWLALVREEPPSTLARPPAAGEGEARAGTAGQPAAPERETLPPLDPPEPLPSFADYVDRLVDIAFDVRDAVEAEAEEAVSRLQAEADAVWLELHETVRMPDEHALFMLCGQLADSELIRDEARRRVCTRVLGAGLAHRLEVFHSTGDRGALDGMVLSMLANLFGSERIALLLAELLIDQPYLGLAHESLVLDLVTAATEHEHLADAASRILTTLWHNLEQTQARTSDELAGLALLFKDDANPSRRLAALEHLLSAVGGRYREVVMHDVLRERDHELARQVAMAAALELEPEDALDVLGRLTSLEGTNLMSAFMALGERDEHALRRAYERQLGNRSHARLRAQLVTGFGFSGTAQAVELARSAFALDPEPDVRASAMFVLTAHAGAALGEQTLMAALDDPELGADPIRLGQVVLALENLARAGQVNAVDRVGQRLLARTELLDADRARLQAVLARVIPGAGAK